MTTLRRIGPNDQFIFSGDDLAGIRNPKAGGEDLFGLTSSEVSAVRVVLDGGQQTYERSVRFKRSALSGAVTNFVATLDLNVAGIQARMLPDGGNVNVRDANGATLPFYLHRRKSIFYGGAAWSWFTNPRAVYNDDSGTAYTFTSYVRGKDQAATSTNAICIASLNHDTNETVEFVLKADSEIDDHNHASIWIRPDGRIVAAYARHNQDAVLRWRVSTNAYDVSAWGAEQTFTASANVTYSNLVYLPTSGRLYNFFRLGTAGWAYVVSTDNGATFSGEVQYVRKIGSQVYQVMRATGDRVDFLTTDGHPNVDGSTSVYHFTMSFVGGAESFSKTDGSAADGSLPFAPQSAFTTVYAYGAGTGDGWLWDVTRDADGAPLALYQRKKSDNSLAEYYFAKYASGAWTSEKIADAGMDISTTDEPNYLGGMSFADFDAAGYTVWLIASPGLTSHAASGVWNLHRYKRVSGTWTMDRAATANDTVSESGAVCIGRPVVPRGQPANTKAEVLYFSGSYLKWDNYNCELMCWPPLITAAFVRVPALSATIDTTISIRFAPTALGASLESKSGVWQDAHFAIMGETLPGRSLMPDDSGNGQDSTSSLATVDRAKRSDWLGTAIYCDAGTTADSTAMRLPTSPALSLAGLTGWTLLFDINPVADGTNTRSIFSSWQGSNTKANVLVRLNTDNTLSALGWSAAGASMGGSLGATTFAAGSWASAAVTYGSVNGFIGYKNDGTTLGAANTTGIGAMHASASDRFSIGNTPHNAALGYDGYLQGLVLMEGELSAHWVKAWQVNRQAYSTLIEMGDEYAAG